MPGSVTSAAMSAITFGPATATPPRTARRPVRTKVDVTSPSPKSALSPKSGFCIVKIDDGTDLPLKYSETVGARAVFHFLNSGACHVPIKRKEKLYGADCSIFSDIKATKAVHDDYQRSVILDKDLIERATFAVASSGADGIAAAVMVKWKPDVPEIKLVCSSKRGAGRAVIEEAIRICSELGATKISLYSLHWKVSTSVAACRRGEVSYDLGAYYRSLGFEEQPTTKEEMDVSGYLMTRNIGGGRSLA